MLGCNGSWRYSGSTEIGAIHRSRPVFFRWTVLLLFALNVIVLAALGVRTTPWLTGDSARYINLATGLRQTGHFGLFEQNSWEPEGWRQPGYPFFLAVFQAGVRHWVIAVVIAQGILFLIALYWFWRLTDTLFGSIVGLVFLAINAGYPAVAFHSVFITAEAVTVFLVGFTFYCLLKPSRLRCVLAGLATGAMVYFRPNMLFLVVPLGIALVVYNRQWLARVAVLVLCTTLVVLPWAVRNLVVFGKFTPLPVISGVGPSLFLATWQGRVSERSLILYGMKNIRDSEVITSGMARQIDEVNARLGVSSQVNVVSVSGYSGNRNKINANEMLRQFAIRNMRADPLSYVRHVLWSTVRIWFSVGALESFSPFVRLLVLAAGVLILIVGVVGFIIALKKDFGQPPAWFTCAALATVLYCCGTLCWFHNEARYTIPVRFVLMVFSARAITEVSEYIFLNLGLKSTSAAASGARSSSGSPEHEDARLLPPNPVNSDAR